MGLGLSWVMVFENSLSFAIGAVLVAAWNRLNKKGSDAYYVPIASGLIAGESLIAAIIAIACDRDLASGIQDASPLPVLGVLNERPCGPCFNTRVNLQDVEEAINFFCQ